MHERCDGLPIQDRLTFDVFECTVSVDLQEPAYKNPRLALWSASKNGLGWLGLTLARASKNIQASLGWRKNRQCW